MTASVRVYTAQRPASHQSDKSGHSGLVVLLAAACLVMSACRGSSDPQPRTPAPGEDAARSGSSTRTVDGSVARATAAAAGAEADRLYEPWARVLESYVDDEGLVDYAGLQRSGRADLQQFMESIGRFDPSTLEAEAEQVAFWINAYNATVLWQVIERYPLESVRDVGALFGLVGGFFKQETLIAGEQRSLDDIEHGILRPRYPDARIHWTLVCAAFGCPRLLRRPYLAVDLDTILTERAYEFLAQPRGLRLQREGNELHVSSYFDWYGDDFEAESGTVVDYVQRYVPPEAAEYIRDNRDSMRVRFMDYDWTLNDQAKGPRHQPER